MVEWKDITLGAVLKYEQPYKYTVDSTQYNKSGIPVLTAGKSFILGYTSETNNLYSNLPVIIFDDFTSDCKFVDFPFKVKSSAMKFLKERNEEEISLKYFYEILQTLKLDSVGGDHKRRWISEYSKIKIKAPDFIEQTHIAEILSTADETIAHTEALIAKYQRIKTGLMQDLLTRGLDENGNIRSKATHKFVLKNGIEVPEEWEVDTIDNLEIAVLDFKANGSFETLTANVKYYYEQNYARLIRLTDLRNGLHSAGVYIDEKGFEFLSKTRLVEGDILISCVGEYTGFVCQMPKVNYKATIAPNMFVIRFNDRVVNSFAAKYMTSFPFQNEIMNVSTSSATKLLNNPNLRSLKLVLPSPKEQKIISDRIDQVENLIKSEHENLHKYSKIKTGLMQDLLSGRVRVNLTN